MSFIPDSFEDGIVYDDDTNPKHVIKQRKYVRTRRIVGIIAGAAVAIGFAALAPREMNVDAVGAAYVGIGSAIIARCAVKQHQKKKLGLKKHNIVKRVLYGKDENRPTIPDRLFLAAAIAPTAITFIAGTNATLIPMIAGVTGYIAKRIYNAVKDKKHDNTEGITR